MHTARSVLRHGRDAALQVLAALVAAILLGLIDPSASAQSQPAPLLEAPATSQAAGEASSQPLAAHSRPAAGLKSFREPGINTSPGGGAAELTWKLASSALVVLLLGAACFWVTRRLLPRMGFRGGRNIHILETAHLGPQKMVHLLRVGDETYLLASTKDRISLLAEVGAAALGKDLDQAGRTPAISVEDDSP
jgi:flagellar biogenesis protein FliO